MFKSYAKFTGTLVSRKTASLLSVNFLNDDNVFITCEGKESSVYSKCGTTKS